jgi:formiminotetrahydrofolate cyclodeaminase
VHLALLYIQEQIETEYQPNLLSFFNNDIKVFDQVSKFRKRRDKEQDEKVKRKLSKQATDKLKEATELPLEVCKACLKLLDFGFSFFDTGFKSARGDSGVAISNLLSAASGSLFITFLNLKTARESKWTLGIRTEAEQLAKEYSKKHKEAIKRITSLYSEGLPTGSTQTELDLE